MSRADRDKWNRIYTGGDSHGAVAAAVLEQNLYLLPQQGTALDLACGRGGNALLLAAHGLETHAWDISDSAIAELNDRAASLQRCVHTRQRDVAAEPPAADSFDVIVVSRFLQRDITPQIKAALKTGGLLYYQTFTREKTRETGPRNPAYLLGPNELLQLFAGLHIIFYQETGRVGDLKQGPRNEAMLIARRRER